MVVAEACKILVSNFSSVINLIPEGGSAEALPPFFVVECKVKTLGCSRVVIGKRHQKFSSPDT